MEYDKTLKLEFADMYDTVLYLNNACPVEVRRYESEITYDDCGIHKLLIFVNGEDLIMSYKDKEKRDIDYNYAIEYIDFLMAPIGTNVDEEEF